MTKTITQPVFSPTAVRRPILRYHGGKWRIAPWIIGQLPVHQTYVEPFCGAASVLLRKPRSKVEVLNDLHRRLISVFRVLRNPEQARLLARQLCLTPYSSVAYLFAREQHPDPVEDARRMLILGHQAHGSTGASGQLSGCRRGVHPRSSSVVDEWALLWQSVGLWAERLQRVYLECEDALRVIRRWDSPETLFYVDPPYPGDTRSASTGLQAYEYEMTVSDHVALAGVLRDVQGMVLLSGYPSKLYDDLYGSWRQTSLSTMSDRGKRSTEVLWMNFEPRQRELFCREYQKVNKETV